LLSSIFSIAMAIGRSKLGPSLRTSAGVRLMVIRCPYGQAQPAVANGGGDPILALLDRGVRETDHRNLVGVSPSGVDFDLHFKRFDTDHCRISGSSLATRTLPATSQRRACPRSLLAADDYVICADEKTSIQARRRKQEHRLENSRLARS
jgi:hypothetical protein